MARRSPTTMLSATAALALLALAACGGPAANRATRQVTVGPGGLEVGGVDGRAGVAAPVKRIDG